MTHDEITLKCVFS